MICAKHTFNLEVIECNMKLPINEHMYWEIKRLIKGRVVSQVMIKRPKMRECKR